MRKLGLVLMMSATVFAGDVLPGNELSAPAAVEAAGVFLDLSDGTGHAAPLVVDWDGDGAADLLVGQFSGGKLRIYRNEGTKEAPTFGAFTWFQADGKDALVPTG